MTEAATVIVDETKFNALKNTRSRVADVMSRYTRSAEETKELKKELDAQQKIFLAEFDRLVNGDVALPLFDHPSDAIAAAEADPVVTKLADRLIGMGHDVNILIVAGYTEDERTQAAAYCDARDARKELETAGAELLPDVEVPAFLVPQPLTDFEVAGLLARLIEAGREVATEAIAGFTLAQRAEVTDWLQQVEAVKAEKGDALVFDDLPVTPAWLAPIADDFALATAGPEEPVSDPTADDVPVEDEPQPVNVTDLTAHRVGSSRRGRRQDGASA